MTHPNATSWANIYALQGSMISAAGSLTAIGIGTTSPDAPLDIKSGTDLPQAVLRYNTTYKTGLLTTSNGTFRITPDARTLQVDTGDGQGGNIQMTKSGGVVSGGISWDTGDQDVTLYSEADLKLGGGGSSAALTVDSSGDTTIAGDLTIESATSDKPLITVKNTNADGNPGTLTFAKDGGSPASRDELGEVVFNNDDSGGSSQFFAKIVAISDTVTAGSLDGSLDIKVRQNQSVKTFTFGDGTYGLTLPDDAQAGILRYKTLSAYSDRALKTNIKTLGNALELVAGLRGVEFDWKSDGRRDVGLVAQEVQDVIPEAVHGQPGSLGVDYAKLTAVLVEAVKDLAKIVADHLPGAPPP